MRRGAGGRWTGWAGLRAWGWAVVSALVCFLGSGTRGYDCLSRLGLHGCVCGVVWSVGGTPRS